MCLGHLPCVTVIPTYRVRRITACCAGEHGFLLRADIFLLPAFEVLFLSFDVYVLLLCDN